MESQLHIVEQEAFAVSVRIKKVDLKDEFYFHVFFVFLLMVTESNQLVRY